MESMHQVDSHDIWAVHNSHTQDAWFSSFPLPAFLPRFRALGSGSWKLVAGSLLSGFAWLQHQDVDTVRIDELLQPLRRAGQHRERAVVHGDDLANPEHSGRQR